MSRLAEICRRQAILAKTQKIVLFLMYRLAGLQRSQAVHYQKPRNGAEDLCRLVDLQCRQVVSRKFP